MNTQMPSEICPLLRHPWQIPPYDSFVWSSRTHPWCVVIPVINEGERIRSLLSQMDTLGIAQVADILIVDGGSNDGSLDPDWLRSMYVCGLLVKQASGGLSAQLRCAYAYALEQGYQGVITIDGNDKDDPTAIPQFIDALCEGVDFAQGSRFITGGLAENTPKSRELAIRYVHAPLLRACSGFPWTDTTQGFRAYSRRMLLDARIAPFREVFVDYELLAYLSWQAPRLGYLCTEIPTSRRYPKGRAPTKISSFRGNLNLLSVLVRTCLGHYSPRTDQENSDKIS
ncbi:dolichol-phosphate mannosyltransferase [Metapseudomonas resinovorans]|uniref:glycosyltransferase family 2 protein n=1 Tax=Metapseudomonas resinovorans TaxID=53412 RepID=UPI003D1E7A66